MRALTESSRISLCARRLRTRAVVNRVRSARALIAVATFSLSPRAWADDEVLAGTLGSAPPPSEPSTTTTSSGDRSDPQPDSYLFDVGPWLVVGAGALTLGVGTWFALKANSYDNESKANGHCSKSAGCDAYGAGKNRDALAAGNVATVLFVGGTGLAGMGVLLYFLGQHDEASAVSVSPALQGEGASVQVSGRF
jgi:hypothetical protein